MLQELTIYIGQTAVVMPVQAQSCWTMLLFAVCSNLNLQGIHPHIQKQNPDLQISLECR